MPDELLNTKNFKKRFHMIGMPEKVYCTELVARVYSTKKMPGGRALKPEELKPLQELTEWCNQNIFFDVMPRWDAIKRDL